MLILSMFIEINLMNTTKRRKRNKKRNIVLLNPKKNAKYNNLKAKTQEMVLNIIELKVGCNRRRTKSRKNK